MAPEKVEIIEMSVNQTEQLEEESHRYQEQPPARLAQDDELPPGYFRSKLFIGTYFAVAVSVLAGTGSFAIIAPLLNTINNELGPDANVVWIGYTYTLCSACAYVLIGRLGDLFGRRYLFIGGNFLSMIGAIIGSRAKSVNMVIGAMTILGVASSTQISFQIIMGELVPLGKRFIVMATMFSWAIPFGGFGAGFGLTLTLHTASGWRSCFYLLAALDALATVLFVLFYYPPTFHDIEKDKSKMRALREFDYLGLILFTGGFFVLLMGLSEGGAKYPWDSVAVIAPIIVGFFSIIAFVFWEIYGNLKAPYMPMHLFKNWRWVCMITCLGIGAAQFYAMALVWPQMIQALWPVTGDKYAWMSATTGGCLIVGQAFGGFLASKVSPRLILLTGTFAGTAFIGGAACANEYNQTTVLVLVVIGFLLVGIQEAVCGTFATMALRDQREIGTGGGLAGSARSGISAIGSVAYGSVLRNTLSEQIPKYVPAAAIKAGLPKTEVAQLIQVLTGKAKAATVAGLTPEILTTATHAYRQAASIAFRNVLLTSVAFGCVSIVCAWFAPTIGKEKHGIVAGTLHKGERGEEEVEVHDEKV
ncbi:MFS general substrate transporter [Rhizodiscina lignyota]|uniref:MFS general substrate transporter n=1 Tax=Rhizodiscina lignyota TaxID=1504668 RepID=A0A9P4IBE0_9PEZI|nr:MFS general substrate transporter [Rhizodiscina lignyota]